MMPVMQISLSGSLKTGAGGASTLNIEASTIQELLTRLVDRFPALQEQLNDGIAVAINGDIYRDDWTQPIPEGAEVFLIPRIAGG